MRTQLHCNDCGAAVDVKTHCIFRELQEIQDGTQAQQELAWEITESEFWRDATTFAQEAGYAGVSACGRSGGWCAPYYQLQGRIAFEDDIKSKQFLAFTDSIEALMKDVPFMYAENVKLQIDEDQEKAVQEAAEDRAMLERAYQAMFCAKPLTSEMVVSLRQRARDVVEAILQRKLSL